VQVSLQGINLRDMFREDTLYHHIVSVTSCKRKLVEAEVTLYTDPAVHGNVSADVNVKIRELVIG